MLLSVNVREDIWHFFYGLKLTQKAVRVILQRQTINLQGHNKKHAQRAYFRLSVLALHD